MGVPSSVVATVGRAARRARFRCLRRFGRRNLLFLVARGLRILQDFAGVFRARLLKLLRISGEVETSDLRVGGSTPSGVAMLKAGLRFPAKKQLRSSSLAPALWLLASGRISRCNGTCGANYGTRSWVSGHDHHDGDRDVHLLSADQDPDSGRWERQL